MSSLTIEGKEIRATSPEGITAAMPLTDFIDKVSGPTVGDRTPIFPDGIKATVRRGKTEIWISQKNPALYSFEWVSNDSKPRFGPGTNYRTVQIALPYLVIFTVFVPGKDGLPTLSKNNECFFSTRPIGWDTELHFPALLNCSKFNPPENHPMVWICSQYLKRDFEREPDISKRMLMAYGELTRCLLETGFNESSEHHEGESWFGATISRSIDPKIESVETWEAASAKNPLFVLDVPWLKTEHTTAQITDRIFDLHKAKNPKLETASDLSRVVFNHAPSNLEKEAV